MTRSLGQCIDGDQLVNTLSQVEIGRSNVGLPEPLTISDTAGMEAM